MARPRLGETERRTRTIGVRVTEVEAEELRERAHAARLSVGAYLRRRGLGQRVRIVADRRLGAAGTAGAEPDRGESQSDGADTQLGSRVVAGRDPGGGRAGRGAGGAPLGRGGGIDGDQDVGPGALVRWGGGLLPARPVGAGVAASGERGAGGVGRRPAIWPQSRESGRRGSCRLRPKRPRSSNAWRGRRRPGESWRSRCAITR